MTDIYFNAKGQTHHMFIEPVDEKPGDITVFEAVVDNTTWTYFEGHHDLEVWELIELAVQSFMDYRVNDEVIAIKWRD